MQDVRAEGLERVCSECVGEADSARSTVQAISRLPRWSATYLS